MDRDRSDVGPENMAEAAVENPAARFFCHRCSLEISPVLPDFICPRCESGFIEELAQGPPEVNEDSDGEEGDPFSQVTELWNMLNYMRRADDPVPYQNHAGVAAQDGNLPRNRPGPSRRARVVRTQARRHGQDFDPTRNRTEGFLHQLVSSLSENTGLVANASFPVFLNLHSNPGDYAWGRGGWNAIITQLINQLDGTGPPPLPKDKIEEIPMVEISQEQVDKALQCTVCMEDYKQGEPVRRLSCEHHFHNDCITPWLELHGTCPICRKLLNDSASQENLFSSSSNDSMSQENNRSSTTTGGGRGNSFNPHVPSVYDFTDEFD